MLRTAVYWAANFLFTKHTHTTKMKRLLILLIMMMPFIGNAQEVTDEQDDEMTMVERGTRDAELHYHRAGGAKAGTFLTTFLAGGIAGLIPAIATSSTAPSYARLDFPDSTLMENADYRAAYIKKAKKMKQGKVWGSYGLGIACTVTLYLLMVAMVA